MCCWCPVATQTKETSIEMISSVRLGSISIPDDYPIHCGTDNTMQIHMKYPRTYSIYRCDDGDRTHTIDSHWLACVLSYVAARYATSTTTTMISEISAFDEQGQAVFVLLRYGCEVTSPYPLLGLPTRRLLLSSISYESSQAEDHSEFFKTSKYLFSPFHQLGK
jgi:hypothetical protein